MGEGSWPDPLPQLAPEAEQVTLAERHVFVAGDHWMPHPSAFSVFAQPLGS